MFSPAKRIDPVITAIIRASVCSAIEIADTPGVFLTAIPRRAG